MYKNNNFKILILGAGGLLGRIIFNELSKKYKVNGTSHKLNKNRNILKVDYKKKNKEFTSLLQKSNIIINCIGESRDEKKMFKTNCDILENVTKIIKKKNTKKIFIHISTCGVYGDTAASVVTEKTVPAPKTTYSKTKFNGEKILTDNLSNKRTIVILRCSQIVGPGMRNTSIKKLYYYINKNLFFFIKNKNSVFSYIFSEDVVNCLFKLINSRNLKDSIYNLSSKSTFEDLVKEINKFIKKNIIIPDINPFLVKILIIFFEDILKINFPINKKQFNSLRIKKIYSSKKIRRYLKIKNFSKIKNKNLHKLIYE